jgi:hypothetical protein
MKNARRCRETGNLAGARRRSPLAGSAYLEDGDVSIRFQAEVFQENPRDHVGRAADAADANALPLSCCGVLIDSWTISS